SLSFLVIFHSDYPITSSTEPLSLHDALPIYRRTKKEILDEQGNIRAGCSIIPKGEVYESHIFTKKEEWFKNKAFTKEVKELFTRSEEHTSELQSRFDLVCRLLLEKKNKHDYE